MIRTLQRAVPALFALAIATSLTAAPTGALAKEDAKGKDSKTKTAQAGKGKPDAKNAKTDAAKDKKSDGKGGKSSPVGRFGEWDVFATSGKGKTCYTLARPKERAPASLKRDDAYVFISNRPGENVRNEVSVIMGFAMKDNSTPKADVGGTSFDLVAKGSNAWLKNAAEEGQFIDALRKGSKLVVRATSAKGNSSTDTYSLAGFGEALARVHKDCP